MNTPVVFIIFKRPDTTQKVFEVIRDAKPPKLFVIADGPRLERPGEAEKCEKTRAIIEQVDWKCEVIKIYSDENMGCKLRVASGLDSVFESVDEAIILEDDCVPHITFFRFCEELLEYYRYDERIMSISGLSVPHTLTNYKYSYHFSLYNRIWGWATWKRAWKHFDLSMKLWTEAKSENTLSNLLHSKKAVDYWSQVFRDSYQGTDSWGYVWTFNCWMQSGISILPSVNLVTNIGFGDDATHTVSDNPNNYRSKLPLEEMTFPLTHPSWIVRNLEAEKWLYENIHNTNNYNPLLRVKGKIKKILAV